MKKRKRITMLLTVTVPLGMTAQQARREVRTLVTEQCNYAADCDDVKAVGCKPVTRISIYAK